MKITWEPSDIKAGRIVVKGTAYLMIVYDFSADVDSCCYSLVDLISGSVSLPSTRDNLALVFSEDKIRPIELVPDGYADIQRVLTKANK